MKAALATVLVVLMEVKVVLKVQDFLATKIGLPDKDKEQKLTIIIYFTDILFCKTLIT